MYCSVERNVNVSMGEELAGEDVEGWAEGGLAEDGAEGKERGGAVKVHR
jgi:hypothetical protein